MVTTGSLSCGIVFVNCHHLFFQKSLSLLIPSGKSVCLLFFVLTNRSDSCFDLICFHNCFLFWGLVCVVSVRLTFSFLQLTCACIFGTWLFGLLFLLLFAFASCVWILTLRKYPYWGHSPRVRLPRVRLPLQDGSRVIGILLETAWPGLRTCSDRASDSSSPCVPVSTCCLTSCKVQPKQPVLVFWRGALCLLTQESPHTAVNPRGTST